MHQHYALGLKTGGDARGAVLRELGRDQLAGGINLGIEVVSWLQVIHGERILAALCAAARWRLLLPPVGLDARPVERMRGPISPDAPRRSRCPLRWPKQSCRLQPSHWSGDRSG